MKSLMMKSFEPFMFLEQKMQEDGEGGFVNVWAEGVTIDASATFDTSIEARSAEKLGVKSLYTITMKKNIPIEYHNVLKRLSDGKIFRITSDGNDKKTPESATFQVQQVTAEEWEPV